MLNMSVLSCTSIKKQKKTKLKILPWTFIWLKLGLNILSHYGDRTPETLPKINLNCYSITTAKDTINSESNIQN